METSLENLFVDIGTQRVKSLTVILLQKVMVSPGTSSWEKSQVLVQNHWVPDSSKSNKSLGLYVTTEDRLQNHVTTVYWNKKKNSSVVKHNED